MSDQDDFYEVLGVPKNATQDEIKKAWRKKAFDSHPDRGGTNEEMYRINYAFEQLSNSDTRRNYDRTRAHRRRSYKGSSSNSSGSQQTESKEDFTHKGQAHTEQPEDYDAAVFVQGIQAKDKYGRFTYIERNDFVYYPVAFKNKIFFWEFKDTEYYRATVKKVYSQKKNSFRQVPLFVIEVEGFQQIIFVEEFEKRWYSQSSFTYLNRMKALRYFAFWVIAIWAAIYLLIH